MLIITKTLMIPAAEIDITFIRSPGPGGQNVNKVATAVQLRFNVQRSASLSDEIKARAQLLFGSRMTQEGELIIKASSYRTQERNKLDALMRLKALLLQASQFPKQRRKTKPTYSAKQKRLETKKRRGQTKSLRNNRDF